jgi:hypothetical protein
MTSEYETGFELAYKGAKLSGNEYAYAQRKMEELIEDAPENQEQIERMRGEWAGIQKAIGKNEPCPF